MSMSTASGTKSKLRETLKQEDAALAERGRTARVPASAKARAAAPAGVEASAAAPAAADVIAPVLPPPKPAAARAVTRPAARKAAGGAAAAGAATVKAGPALVEAEKAGEKPADKLPEGERKDKHEKVERDSFSMPASEHKRIKALREALGKDGVLASKSEVLRAGLALLAEQDSAEIGRLIAALPKVAKGKRARKH
jgi:Arc/MetJ-type ribon-helix-helix transcriptional regulator